MPRRTDIRSILIIGSGPIVIGQGCEFDYSGVQACRALREEGYRIVLINSNPATIMTDPEFADATYIEPITPEAVEKILEREKQNGTPVDALLPTLGGQTGLNTGMACWDKGILQKYGVRMIGANRDAIHRGEDRQVFKELMISIGLKVPRSGVVHNMEDARQVLEDIGLPLIIRPAFTLGGTGGGIAYNREEFEEIVQRGLDASPVTEVLIEQSVIGWKEYEMEVMRDKNDNVVIICSIENIDAMGVHTGDSITVAPIQTLTDKEYQRMRDASIAVIRAVGVETGGSNIQFGINPDNGDMVVIEMNPRVSRSSALASKATGYPIAKLAAKLAVGYTLDELPNYITSRKRGVTATAAVATAGSAVPTAGAAGGTAAPITVAATPAGGTARPAGGTATSAKATAMPKMATAGAAVGTAGSVGGTAGAAVSMSTTSDSASDTSRQPVDVREEYELYTSACFEPTIDYCVIKIPRWTFEKFPDADETLTTQMKSVGEAMAIGRTFKEALQKGIRSMEVKRFGFGLDKYDKWLNAQKASTANGSPAAPPRDAQNESPRSQSLSPSREPTDRRPDPNRPAVEDASDKTTQGESLDHEWPIPEEKLRRKLAVPSQGRLYYVRYALKMGWTVEQIYELTKIDPWFLGQMKELVEFEDKIIEFAEWFRRTDAGEKVPAKPWFMDFFREAKSLGYSDVQLENVIGRPNIRAARTMGLFGRTAPVYKLVDTCAAEFEASTPYYYSTYETPFTVNGKAVHEDEIRLTDRPKVIIIGGGPNRIGQGIEFDYCCVQAAFAMRELGIESVMINSNPETVSTDYDTSDLLFFEPLTHEDVLNICERLNGVAFNELPEIDFVDGASPSDPRQVAALRDYLRSGKIGRVAVFSVTESGAQEHYSDLGPSTTYNFIDDGGELHCVYFEHDSPIEGVWGSRSGTWPAISKAEEAALRTRFAGKLPPTKKGLVEGVVVQYGGQTPLNLAKGLMDAGVPILGTPVDSLDQAGDRERFRTLLEDLELKQPPNGIARNVDEARKIAREIGYPVLVRPSFVLGGRAMEIVSDEAQLNYYMANAIDANAIADAPILVDKFLDNATEVDVDCIADFEPRRIWPHMSVESRWTPEGREAHAKRDPMIDGVAGPDGSRRQAIVIGVMEHIEEAGIHSGDSACTLPPYSLSPDVIAELKRQTKELARALRVKGLMNVQYAIKDGEIYVIEVNPRASRTVPFVGKATGIPWAKVAAKVMTGKTLDELGVTEQPDPSHVSVKEAVFPFSKFPGVDVILGPEMRSTGEVMGIDRDFPMAFAKSQLAAGNILPTRGTVFISVRDADKAAIIPVAQALAGAGFEIIASAGTYAALAKHDIPATKISKLSEGRPNIKDYIKNGQVHLIINTPTRKGPQTDEGKIRSLAVLNKVPIVTTITGASAAAKAIQALQANDWEVRPLQDYFLSAK